MSRVYIEPTEEAGIALFSRQITGKVVMLNLLRFRDVADYSANPELAGDETLSGRQAFEKYMRHSAPFLEQSGGRLLFVGEGGNFFIGPDDERWDLVILVEQNSLQDFLAFASNPGYLAGLGHRTAAIEDSRLLPVIQNQKTWGQSKGTE